LGLLFSTPKLCSACERETKKKTKQNKTNERKQRSAHHHNFANFFVGYVKERGFQVPKASTKLGHVVIADLSLIVVHGSNVQILLIS
jgi:hypothetical protein